MTIASRGRSTKTAEIIRLSVPPAAPRPAAGVAGPGDDLDAGTHALDAVGDHHLAFLQAGR